jgi:hypothetical protein
MAGRAKLVRTYRTTAFSSADAERLLDLVTTELQGAQRRRRQAVG